MLIVIVLLFVVLLSSSGGAGAWFLMRNKTSSAVPAYIPPAPVVVNPPFVAPVPVPAPPVAAPPAGGGGGNRDPSRKCRGRGKDVGKPGGVYTWDFDSRDGADLYTCPGYDNWCCKINPDGSVAPGWGRGGGLFAFEKLDSKGCGVETGAQYCNSNPAPAAVAAPAGGGGGNAYGTPQCQWPNDPNLPDAATQNARGEPWFECPDDKTKCCNTKTSARHPVCGSYPGSSQATCQRPGSGGGGGGAPPPSGGGGGGGGGGTYIVQSGDSLWAIANKHGMSLDALRGLNPGVSDLIMPGQAIKVSGAAAPPAGGGGGGSFDCGSVAPNRLQGCTPSSCPGCPAGYTWTQIGGRLMCGRARPGDDCPSQTDTVAHGSSPAAVPPPGWVPMVPSGGGSYDCGSVGPNRQQGCTPSSCSGCPPGYTWTQVNGQLKCGRANAQECPSQTDTVAHGWGAPNVVPKVPGWQNQPALNAPCQRWQCKRDEYGVPMAEKDGGCVPFKCGANGKNDFVGCSVENGIWTRSSGLGTHCCNFNINLPQFKGQPREMPYASADYNAPASNNKELVPC